MTEEAPAINPATNPAYRRAQSLARSAETGFVKIDVQDLRALLVLHQNVDLYAHAVMFATRDKPSTSYVQRKLGIGYNLASAFMLRMEHAGVISGPDRAGARRILVPWCACTRPEPGKRYRHRNRGSAYTVLGEARLQQAGEFGPTEGDAITFYRGDDGQLWARASSEFHDGRFEELDAEAPA